MAEISAVTRLLTAIGPESPFTVSVNEVTWSKRGTAGSEEAEAEVLVDIIINYKL
jgi:hypothetical protein